MYFLSLI